MPSLTNQIRENVHADAITKRRKDGVIVLRRAFFYRHGGTAEKFADRVREAFVKYNIPAKVINSGEVWKPFRGGATVASQSHWFVEVVENNA
jgi:hypothetical protein